MSDIENWIKELSAKIESLQQKQYAVNNELQSLHNQLQDLKNLFAKENNESNASATVYPEPVIEYSKPSLAPPVRMLSIKPERPVRTIIPNQKLEDFIGTNLISKVGIVITIIGVFIGAKYAIDKELISAAMRIVLGYASGAILIFIALRLKTKYENFSAVLMGGGLAVLYFITYIAYGFYQLFPQGLSFLLMIVITAAAVGIALWYNQKIIAVLGQIAAYAIPFLLSNGSGKVLVLFSYISIINIGLLILSFKRDWKVLYRIAFFLTWIIYVSWLTFKKPELVQQHIGLIFLFINFFTFYATFLSYKVVKRELYNIADISILLLNALLFFFLGTYLINNVYTDPHVLTYFTILNAVIHFAIGLFIYRQKLADHSVYQFIIGLGILFFTISIPVELNGSWVTLLWSFEAAVLCHIAFKNNEKLYLTIAIPMIIIAAISLVQDWFLTYPHFNYLVDQGIYQQPFLNLNFWFSLMACACFGYIAWLSQSSTMKARPLMLSFFDTIMPIVFVLGLYAAIFNEIHFAFDAYIKNNSGENIFYTLTYYQQLSLIVYSFLYFAVCFKLNNKFFKSKTAVDLLLIPAGVCVLIFLLFGLNIIGYLRENYVTARSRYTQPSLMMILVRYVCFSALAILIFNAWVAVKNTAKRKDTLKIFSSFFNITLLAVICNEFVNWMYLAGYQDQYKLGLTIIWGLYALVLIFAGIKNKQKHLRISAIILFGTTLLKLFFYDLSSLPTISKTIVLVMLGVILLVVSFMYNKYKAIIFADDDSERSQ